jgi:hypothetical protein
MLNWLSATLGLPNQEQESDQDESEPMSEVDEFSEEEDTDIPATVVPHAQLPQDPSLLQQTVEGTELIIQNHNLIAVFLPYFAFLCLCTYAMRYTYYSPFGRTFLACAKCNR